MGIIEFPEVRIARKIFIKHSLSIPFDIKNLIRQYAILVFEDIPFEGIDGVSVNIKVPHKKPTIIVNNNIPAKRQLFTLAHELGHLVIPWHIGTIIDELGYDNTNKLSQYYNDLEREANRFAFELLMPKEWILSTYKNNKDFDNLCFQICTNCGVTEQDAKIRIKQLESDL